jgi:hypothetical protein
MQPKPPKQADTQGYALEYRKHFDLADLSATPLSKNSGRNTIDESLRYLETP